MTDEDTQATLSRLRAELATAVAAAAEREEQLQADLHERFVETAELTRQLLAAEQRATTAERGLARARDQIAALKERLRAQEAASRSLASRVRGRLRRRSAGEKGKD